MAVVNNFQSIESSAIQNLYDDIKIKEIHNEQLITIYTNIEKTNLNTTLQLEPHSKVYFLYYRSGTGMSFL